MCQRASDDDWCACVKEDEELQAKEDILKSSLKTLKEKIHALRVENLYLTSLLEKHEDEEQESVNDSSGDAANKEDALTTATTPDQKLNADSIKLRPGLLYTHSSRRFVDNVIFVVFFSLGVAVYSYLYFR